MKITALEEYGLRCVLRLALAPEGEPMTVAEIAEKEGLDRPLRGKLMSVLRQSGLVDSVRGEAVGTSSRGRRPTSPSRRSSPASASPCSPRLLREPPGDAQRLLPLGELLDPVGLAGSRGDDPSRASQHLARRPLPSGGAAREPLQGHDRACPAAPGRRRGQRQRLVRRRRAAEVGVAVADASAARASRVPAENEEPMSSTARPSTISRRENTSTASSRTSKRTACRPA